MPGRYIYLLGLAIYGLLMGAFGLVLAERVRAARRRQEAEANRLGEPERDEAR